MLQIARTEQDNVDARLVPHEAVGGFGDCARTPLIDEKAERVGRRQANAAIWPLAVRSRNAAARRPGFEKMLCTANISNVPIRLAIVTVNTLARAFWCIMWNATMTVSHTPSSTARRTILCSGSAC